VQLYGSPLSFKIPVSGCWIPSNKKLGGGRGGSLDPSDEDSMFVNIFQGCREEKLQVPEDNKPGLMAQPHPYSDGGLPCLRGLD
jgi:hypothetical protein